MRVDVDFDALAGGVSEALEDPRHVMEAAFGSALALFTLVELVQGRGRGSAPGKRAAAAAAPAAAATAAPQAKAPAKKSFWGKKAAAAPKKEDKKATSRRFRTFLALVATSVYFLLGAFLWRLPLLLVDPEPFAISFTMGSLCCQAALMVLKGPVAHLKGMFTLQRAPFALLYFGSMFGTLYAALVTQSEWLVIALSAAQVTALLYFVRACLQK